MQNLLQYRLDERHNTLFVKSTGILTTVDAMRLNQEVHDSPTMPRGWSALVDLRDVTEFQIDSDGMRAIVEQDKELFNKYEFTRLAFVASHDVVFGMARMYQSLTAEAPAELQVYRDIDSALKWLNLDHRILEEAYAT